MHESDFVVRGVHFSTDSSDTAWDVSLVGLKAVGLAALPVDWTPPFLVITADAFDAWRNTASLNSGQALLSPNALAPILRSPESKLIVRSSADIEDAEYRGWLESKICASTIEGIIAAATDVWSRVARTIERLASPVRVALVVQQFEQSKLYGHLSNERRVSRNRNRWLCEIESPVAGIEPVLMKFDAKSSGGPLPQRLDCTNDGQLLEVLKQVAGWTIHNESARCHYEWVWDGSRLWIVQRDLEREIHGRAPATSDTSRQFNPAPAVVSIFVEATKAEGDWKKTESLRLFQRAGLPAAQLYLLEHEPTLAKLGNGIVSPRLRDDLRALLASPIVFRTDVLTSDSLPAFLSPRSETLLDVDTAAAWLTSKAKMLIEKGATPSGFCFIAHRYISARSAAISLSRPKNPRVKIDAIWGFPDGLLSFPHDSFEVTTNTRMISGRQVRSKPFFLKENALGSWVRERCPAPWDWRPSLTNAEILEIAEHSKRLANFLGEPVEVMFFVGVDPKTGYPAILPWIHMEDVPTAQQEANAFHYAGKPFTITNSADLVRLKEIITREQERQKVTIRLRPAPHLLRSKEFVDEVAATARELRIPVQLEGSILSHIYYMLTRLRVRVRCGDPIAAGSYKQRFGKLVRDLIPIKIHSQGESAKTLRVSSDALIGLLKAKALEEAFEAFWERDPNQSFAELADVLEVIVSSCKAYNRSFDDLLKLAEEKRNERGGFEHGIVLVETDAVPLIESDTAEPMLFSGEGPSRAPRSHKRNAVTSLTTRRPRLKGREVIIPMIPPSADQFRTTYLRLTETNQEVEVTYSAKEVRVTIRGAKKLTADPNQLWLPLG
jgi:predicted house-cleaning noncanonical NTP pyrophosphatase (MazG superfamily)